MSTIWLKAHGHLSRIQALDSLLRAMDPEISPEISSILTWKSVMLTLWSRACLDMEAVVDAIDLSRFQPFFAALFSQEKNARVISDNTRMDFIQWLESASGKKEVCNTLSDVMTALFDELEDEFAGVHESDIEPALMAGHFLL